MKQLISICLLLISGSLFAQDLGKIEGFVFDKEVNHEPLPFVHVSVKGTDISAITDLDGKHTLQLRPGTHILVFNFPGYEKVILKNVVVTKDETLKLPSVVLSALKAPLSADAAEKTKPISSRKK